MIQSRKKKSGVKKWISIFFTLPLTARIHILTRWLELWIKKNLSGPQPQPSNQPSFSGYLFGFLYGLIVTVITATAGILAAHLIIVVCPIITNILIFDTNTTTITTSQYHSRHPAS